MDATSAWDARRIEERVASDEVVIAAFDRDPRNYSKAMHSSKCMEW